MKIGELWVTEIKIRARRKLGKIASKLKTEPGKRTNNEPRRSGATRLKGKREILKQAGISKDIANRCEKIAAIPIEKFEKVIADAKENKPITYADVEKLITRKHKEEKREEKRQENRKKIADNSTNSVIKGLYSTIVIDPPWDWRDEGDHDQLGRSKPDYSTMTIDELKGLKVDDIAENILNRLKE